VGVIGDTLSEARTRRGVDLDEVHAATGIRPRYLRAIEQEDWDALPEEFYARSFIRKYAQFLGVEPEPLVAEYRRQRGTGGGRAGAPTTPFAGTTTSRRAEALRRRRARQGVYAWLGGIAALIVVVVVAILLLSGGGEEGAKQASGGTGAGGKNANGKGASKGGAGGHASGKGAGGNGAAGNGKKGAGGGKAVALKIEPTAEVWACVLDAKGKPLVDGATLAAGERTGPFHSRSYTAAFGNGSVEVWIDGKRAQTPSTPSPMGFTVDRHGKLHEIPEGERPSCG
jgi:transcriptional regulator with XRE-family HTH domain